MSGLMPLGNPDAAACVDGSCSVPATETSNRAPDAMETVPDAPNETATTAQRDDEADAQHHIDA